MRTKRFERRQYEENLWDLEQIGYELSFYWNLFFMMINWVYFITPDLCSISLA